MVLKFKSSTCLPSTSGICQMPSTRPRPAGAPYRLQKTLCSTVLMPHPNQPILKHSLHTRGPIRDFPGGSARVHLAPSGPPAGPAVVCWPCSQADTRQGPGQVGCCTHLLGHGGPAEACRQKQFCTGSHCGSQLAGQRSSAFRRASLSPTAGPLWSGRKNGSGHAGCPGSALSRCPLRQSS